MIFTVILFFLRDTAYRARYNVDFDSQGIESGYQAGKARVIHEESGVRSFARGESPAPEHGGDLKSKLHSD